MNNRDKNIVEGLRTFRVLSRDQLIQLYFQGLKNPINSANNVLKRLSRDGLIKCSKKYTPYVYFLAESKIKQDSQKIPHFLSIASTIIEMIQLGHPPKNLSVEPKYGKKGTVEPDIMCKWLGMPVFLEVQRSVYTQAVMQKKIDLYEKYFASGDWRKEPYQEAGRERFPTVILITSTRYAVKSPNFNIIQVASVTDFYNMVRQKQNKKPVENISVSSNLKFKSN